MKGWLGLVAVAMVVVAAFLPSAAAQGLTPSQCNNQKNNIKYTCKSVVVGNASAACCQLIRTLNLECICQFITPKVVAALGGAARTIKVVRGCGRNLPRNFKCGSLTTPP